MTLFEQITSLIYHFIMGQVFALLYSFLSICSLSFQSKSKIILTSIFTMSFTCIYYYGLFQINGGIINIYLGLLFSLGLTLYYHTFYAYLLPIFLKIKKYVQPIRKKLFFAKIKIYDIMSYVRIKRRR